jgi:RNA 2',3'-cyclic 3'-phosphodiesterase
MDEKTLRAFVALELPAEVKTRLGALQTRLRPHVAGLRFVAADSLHLTLRFLGEVTPRQIESIAGELAGTVVSCPRATVALGGLGLFPERGAPRTLWVGLSLPPALLELQRACERAARAAGLQAETRPFTAHLTLGRWRERAPRPTLAPQALGKAELARLVLYRSELRMTGAVHTPLQAFELAHEVPA